MIVAYGPEENPQGVWVASGRFMNTDGHRFTLQNKNVYEIYHGDNLFNPLGTHTHNGEVVRRRIASIENTFSTDVKYFFYNGIDNCYEICECPQTKVRRRANGFTISNNSNPANIPANYTVSQPAPLGGDALTNYYYNHDPLTFPATINLTAQNSFEDYHTIVSVDTPNVYKDYGIKGYSLAMPNNPNDLTALIRMPDDLNFSAETGVNRVRIMFTYRNTARRYCNPACFAGFIGMLAQLNREDIVCTGMCFADATSYPSVSHPNGDSVDTVYYATLADEQLKVNAFRDHYFTNILRGNLGWYPQLTNTSYSRGHNDHLHAGEFNNTLITILNQ